MVFVFTVPSPLRFNLFTRSGTPGLRRALRRRRRTGTGAFTVIEVCVAGAIITIFLSSLFALNSDMIHLLRAASEAANASQDLQSRVEAVRLANWTQITDPVWMGKNLYINTTTDAKANLPGMTETAVVSAFSSPSSAASTSALPTPFTITYNSADGSVNYPTSYTSSTPLAQQEMIRVDLTISWPSLYRPRSRTLTTVVSRWGISK